MVYIDGDTIITCNVVCLVYFVIKKNIHLHTRMHFMSSYKSVLSEFGVLWSWLSSWLLHFLIFIFPVVLGNSSGLFIAILLLLLLALNKHITMRREMCIIPLVCLLQMVSKESRTSPWVCPSPTSQQTEHQLSQLPSQLVDHTRQSVHQI